MSSSTLHLSSHGCAMETTAFSAEELLQRRLNLSEVQISVLSALARQLPDVNSLMENSVSDLSEIFVGISDDVTTLQKQLALQGDGAKDALATTSMLYEKLGRVITGMQFQDRVSQNFVIAINVIREVCAELNQYSSDIRSTIGHGEVTPDGDSITMFLEILKLGEVKQLFLDFLKERGHHAVVESVGGGYHGHVADEDDIELF
jgi:hypothetical protein